MEITTTVACAPVIQKTIHVKASESSVNLRNEVFASHGVARMTAEEGTAYFNNYMVPYLSNRIPQSVPWMQTNSRFEQIEYPSGNVYTFTGEKEDVFVLYIHGGAWVWEIDGNHIGYCDSMVNVLNAKVYLPDYPLAPQADYN